MKKLSFSYEKIDITPPIGIRLGGYAHRLGKPSIKVHDPLYSRLLYITNNVDEILIVQMDILGIYLSDAENIKEKIHRKTGIKKDNIFIIAIHNHSSPETIIPMWPNTFPYSIDEKNLFDKWWNITVNKIVEASQKTVDSYKNGIISFGKIPVKQLCGNRTYGEEGEVSKNIYVVTFRNSESNILLLNYACHPVCNTDLGISADYPGAIYSEMLKKGWETIFTTGSTGDINPLQKGRQYIDYIGKTISQSICENLNILKEVGENTINIWTEYFKVRLRTPSIPDPKQYFLKTYERCGDNQFKQECLVKLLYADEFYEISKDGKHEKTTIIRMFSIGKLLFITVPGEMFLEIENELRSEIEKNGMFPIFSNYSEDYIGYIPTKKAFELNRYEARLARWSRITPTGVKRIKNKIREIYKNNL